MKLIKVESCKECPHHGKGRYESACKLSLRSGHDMSKIPTWCPLEDETPKVHRPNTDPIRIPDI